MASHHRKIAARDNIANYCSWCDTAASFPISTEGETAVATIGTAGIGREGMTDGQVRVMVLIFVLIALELALQPAAKKAIMSTWGTFNNALSQASKPATGGTTVA